MTINTYKKELSINEKNYKKKMYIKDNKVEDAHNYLKMWAKSPSFNDINANLTTIKFLLVLGLFGFLFFLTYLIFKNIFALMSISIFIFIFFIIAFHDQIFSLNNLISRKFISVSKINPFKTLRFWTMESKPDTLFYTNIKDLINVGLKIFNFEIVADNVNPNYNQLFSSLSEFDVPFTYQIIQKPFISSIPAKGSNTMKMKQSANSMKTIIYFCVFYDIKGLLNGQKLRYLIEVLEMFSVAINNAFKANFRHFKIKSLKNDELVNGLRTIFLKSDTPDNNSKKNFSSQNLIVQALKSIFIIIVAMYFCFILIKINVHFIIIMILVIGMVFTFINLFWREILFIFSKKSSYINNNIQVIDPFKDISFYYYKHFPDCLFIVISEKLIIGTKIFNISHSRQQKKKIPKNCQN